MGKRLLLQDSNGKSDQQLQLLNAVTTGTSVSATTSAADDIAVWIEWSAGVSAGVVTIESARLPGYTGSWAQEGQSSFNASATDRIQIKGPVENIRARVSTTVVGGTVSAWIIAEGSH